MNTNLLERPQNISLLGTRRFMPAFRRVHSSLSLTFLNHLRIWNVHLCWLPGFTTSIPSKCYAVSWRIWCCPFTSQQTHQPTCVGKRTTTRHLAYVGTRVFSKSWSTSRL